MFFFPLIMLLALSGECQTVATATVDSSLRPGESQGTLQSRPAVPTGSDYRVGIGDVLRVSVFEEPQFTADAMVRPDGKISLPLIAGVKVTGLTPDEAASALTEQISLFVKHPRVSVIVEEIHSRIVYITGEVQHPGAYPLLSPENVVQLIARAGGTTEYAKKKAVYVLHPDGGARVKVNYQMLLAGRHTEENIGLNPGDTVVVP